MTVAHLCDGPGCGGRIDVKGYGWFGLDEAVRPDDDEPDEWFDSEDYGLHFCSLACLAAWAMDTSVDRGSTKGVT